MGIDEKELNCIEQIWRNDFALLYEDRPRLYHQLKTCTLDIGMTEIEPGIEMLVIVFYVQNEIQCSWIERNVLSEMQDRFAEIAGLEPLTLSVDISREENQ